MNSIELKEKLTKGHFNPICYDLDGGLSHNKYCLHKYPWGKWSVYYCERDEKIDEKFFDNESDACICLLEYMEKDPTTRLNY